jgi:Actinobacteria/chloroflexi VLRF1 release factor
MSVRFIGRANVRKLLEPLEGGPGSTVYEDGSVQVVSDTGGVRHVFRPSFGLSHRGTYATVHVEPLLEAIEQNHVVAVLLVRLGGYAAGMFEGEQLVRSKVGARFVKNRNKKGGSSSNRFRRRREEQANVLIREAADVAASTLTDAPFSALGGDRTAVNAVIDERRDLAWLRERAVPRFFTVPDPRQRTLETFSYDLYAVRVEELDA